MEQRANEPGVKTSEFWITAIMNIAGAVLALVAMRGFLSQDEADLWLQLIRAIVVAVVPVAMAYQNAAYIQGRTELKKAELEKGK